MTERLSDNEWSLIGQWIKDEKERRLSRRRDREKIWKEIDRQIAMTPLPMTVQQGSGTQKDWYPELELPLQFNALEVIAADARRLKFPRGTSWYEVSAFLSDEYLTRFDDRRTKFPMIGDLASPMTLNQATADTLVKSVIDHYHRLYDFRAAIDLFDVEMIKYGTGVTRTLPVRAAKWSHDYRGIDDDAIIGPATIACSIKSTYLDDTTSAAMHEGELIGPSPIRCKYQLLADLERAAKAGGPERGWMPDRIARLLPIEGDDAHKQQVELLEFEGDLVVPKTEGHIWLPNTRLTIAVGKNCAEPVRFRTGDMPFRSYVVGRYMQDDVETPYGTSPLMKGQPIAEAAALALNDLMAASALNARPPVAYDRNDANLAVMGGPKIAPGAMWGTDSPNAIEVQEVGDPAALFNVYLGLVKQFEDVTGVNDPRRGSEIKSHTTAYQADVQSTKGLSRTDDFVTAEEQGPVTTMLYMQFAIAKKVLTKPQPILVNSAGMSGWAEIAGQDLADRVAFAVNGSSGVLQEREKNANFVEAAAFAVQMSQASMQLLPLAAQMGIPMAPLLPDFKELAVERFTRAGINDTSRYFAAQPAVPQGGALGPPVPDAAQGNVGQPQPAPAVAPGG